ncbi:MAG: Enolase, partial [uncultured Solirubrobacteraceae bacterium]
VPDRDRPRPPDPRLAGQPDGGGRARAALGRGGPRGGPLRRLHGRVRGHRAARRRRGLPGQGGHPGGHQRQHGDRPGDRRLRRARPVRPRPRAHRARRHAEQGAPRGQRDPRRVPRRGPSGRRGGAPAPVALPGRRGGARAARADDERAQRRRPRRQLRRLPGVHGRPLRRRDLQRGPAHGRRGLPPPQEDAGRARHEHRGGRRGRLRAGPRVQRGRARAARRGDPLRRLRAGRRRRHRPGPRHERDPLRGPLQPREREPRALRRRDGRLLGRPRLSLPDRLDRGRHGRGGLGRLEVAHPARRRPRPARRRRPLRHEH